MDHVLVWLVEWMPQQLFIPNDIQVHEILEPTEDEKRLGELLQVLKVFKKSAPKNKKCKAKQRKWQSWIRNVKENPLFAFLNN